MAKVSDASCIPARARSWARPPRAGGNASEVAEPRYRGSRGMAARFACRSRLLTRDGGPAPWRDLHREGLWLSRCLVAVGWPDVGPVRDTDSVEDRYAGAPTGSELDVDLAARRDDHALRLVERVVLTDLRSDVERDQVRRAVHDHVELPLARPLVLDLRELELQEVIA